MVCIRDDLQTATALNPDPVEIQCIKKDRNAYCVSDIRSYLEPSMQMSPDSNVK